MSEGSGLADEMLWFWQNLNAEKKRIHIERALVTATRELLLDECRRAFDERGADLVAELVEKTLRDAFGTSRRKDPVGIRSAKSTVNLVHQALKQRVRSEAERQVASLDLDVTLSAKVKRKP